MRTISAEPRAHAQPPSQAAFSPEEVNVAVKDCIESVLAGQTYNEDKVRAACGAPVHASGSPACHPSLSRAALWTLLQVSAWTNQCLEGCMKRLTALGKPYKYVATCIIMQKTGEGRRRGAVQHAAGPHA